MGAHLGMVLSALSPRNPNIISRNKKKRRSLRTRKKKSSLLDTKHQRRQTKKKTLDVLHGSKIQRKQTNIRNSQRKLRLSFGQRASRTQRVQSKADIGDKSPN